MPKILKESVIRRLSSVVVVCLGLDSLHAFEVISGFGYPLFCGLKE